MPRLPPEPQLDWSADGVPRAIAFDDIYFSREGGLAESEAVFLRGCGLPDAWAGRARFAICELGFGTGLNVLATWRAWKARREPHAILHISSIEAFPLARADAARALAQFPEIRTFSDKLLARWPVRTYAPQRFWFPEDGFALTLHIGEAERVLNSLHARYDSWFLDGFAPSRNAAMWTPALIKRIAALSNRGARLASFTIAGEVRRALEAHGFVIARKPGFGRKRERLEAVLASPPPTPPALFPYGARSAPRPPMRVAIVGAGIAGAATAAALARRGVETIVLDAGAQLGAGASGNRAGLVMPRLDRGGALAEVFLASYLDAVAAYEALGVFERCGVEERADARRREAFEDLRADPPLPPDWFAPLGDGAVLHARAGLVRPLDAIGAMLKDAALLCDAPVAALEQAGEGWMLRAPGGRALLKADAIVLACGAGLTGFEPSRFLPIETLRGQIEWGALTGMIEGAPPPHALVESAYAAPFNGGLLFGATFERAGDGVEADERSRQLNLAALRRLAPELAARLDLTTLASRASLRAAAPDYAPVAGLLPHAPKWLAQNEGLKHGRKANFAPAPAYEGVYVIGALGARGLTLAPLLGERIGAELCGEPQVLSQPALDAIHPARFLHRRVRRSG